jgi:TPR repeat protein
VLKPLLTVALLCASLPAAAAAEKAMLRVSCDGADADAAVYVNGVFKGECPVDISVDAGTATVKVIKPQDAETERVFERELRLAGGTAKRVEVVLGAPQPSERALFRAKEQARQAARNTERIAQLSKAKTDADLVKLRKLAESGDSNAMVAWANLLADGKQVPKDDALSTQWHEKAAAAGNPEGMYWLGLRYAIGRGVPEDHQKASEWYRKGAEAGSLDAMGGLAARYSSGNGVTEDAIAAAKWAQKGAPSPRALAVQAWQLMREIPAKGALSEAQQRDMARAMPLLESAGAGGSTWALVHLGRVQLNGWYGQQVNPAAAVASLNKAVETGDWNPESRRDANYLLAQIKLDGAGPGGVKDPEGGRKLMLLTAEEGHELAMRYVGATALKGDGVALNYEQALYWFTRCAKLDNGECMFALGVININGYGVPVNKTVAAEWFRKAEKRGVARAANALRAIGQ